MYWEVISNILREKNFLLESYILSYILCTFNWLDILGLISYFENLTILVLSFQQYAKNSTCLMCVKTWKLVILLHSMCRIVLECWKKKYHLLVKSNAVWLGILLLQEAGAKLWIFNPYSPSLIFFFNKIPTSILLS